MTAMTIQPPDEALRRSRRFGVFSLLCAAIMGFVFATDRGGQSATFVLNDARGGLVTLPDIVVPVLPVVLVLAAAVVAIAAVQFVRGFGDKTIAVVGIVAALFVVAFLTWAAADASVSLVALLRGTIQSATPIAFGALCGVLCERAGVINIAIEGQFLAAAFTAAVVSSVAGNPWVGLIGGVLAGVLIAWMLAGLSIRYKADQIVAGVVLIVFATGVTSFLASQVLTRNAHLNSPARFTRFEVPFLFDIPVVGPVLFRNSVIGFGLLATVAILQYALWRTRWGLRLRSVGEHPKAADTVGIDVIRTRWRAVLFGGAIAGIGGAWFTLDSVGQFSREMSAGKGFIALAAMLVGRYSPIGAFGAALIFGFAEALATTVQRLPVPIPSTLMLTAPYIVTIFVVAGLIGRLRPPAADGQPYEKE